MIQESKSVRTGGEPVGDGADGDVEPKLMGQKPLVSGALPDVSRASAEPQKGFGSETPDVEEAGGKGGTDYQLLH